MKSFTKKMEKHFKKGMAKKGFLGPLQQLPAAVILFSIAFIILGFVAGFLATMRDSSGASTTVQYSVLNNSLEGANKIGQQGSNIGQVIAIVIIIGILVAGFGYLIARKKDG